MSPPQDGLAEVLENRKEVPAVAAERLLATQSQRRPLNASGDLDPKKPAIAVTSDQVSPAVRAHATVNIPPSGQQFGCDNKLGHRPGGTASDTFTPTA